jgi:hypothetical protein
MRLTALFFCVLVAGCGGLYREFVYRPLAPVDAGTEAALGREGDFYWWHLELDDAELILFPVTISGKTTWIFGPFIAFPVSFLEEEVPEKGPLEIRVILRVKPGTRVAFDTREFEVLLEDGRSLPPTVTVWGPGTDEAQTEPPGPVTLYSVNWSRSLQYDVLVSELTPFTLRLGTLTLNGDAIQLPPVRFVRGKRYRGS